MLENVLEFIALLGVGVIGGAMIYESLVEIGVRQKTSAVEKLRNWNLCFPAASGLFKPFGIVLMPLLIACGFFTANITWHIAGALMFALIPFTAIAIAATNSKILAMTDKTPSGEIESAIASWDKLHHVRTALTVSAFLLGAYAVCFN